MKYKHVLALNPYCEETSATMGIFPPTGLEYIASNIKDLVGKVTLLEIRRLQVRTLPGALPFALIFNTYRRFNSPFPSPVFPSGAPTGLPIAGGCVQVNLDFGKREKELFNSKEMGEDVQRALASYLKLLPKIKSRIIQEKPVLEQALKWGKEAL